MYKYKMINNYQPFIKNYIKSLHIKENYIILNDYKFELNSQFAYYLTGLIEGDGSIYVPPLFSNIKGKYRYPVIKITFAEKDLPLAEKLNERLKYGKIYKEKGKYVNLVFYKLNIIFLIAYLINGKMRTPKIEASVNLIK
jgi:hypothetical protein